MMQAEEVLDLWEAQRGQGRTVAQAAEVIGMKLDTLQTVLRRARARGDRRGDYEPLPRPQRGWRRRDELVAAWVALEPTTWPGLTYAEAASLIGCSRSALTTAVSRARRAGIEVPAAPPYVDPTR